MAFDWREQLERRRVWLIAPAAFAGLVTFSSRRTERPAQGGEVELIEFGDDGRAAGLRRVPRLVLTNAEWRARLTAQQYYVTRQGSTDMAYTGTYYKLHAPGIFRCVCCGTALFLSADKFDSGTGWPSFTAPAAAGNIVTHLDTSLFLERTEVTCARCGAHLGHVFPDGPAPTHLRYCINESALRFSGAGPPSPDGGA